MIRVALVESIACTSIRRAASFVDDVKLASGKPRARGRTLSTDVAAYTLLALRTALRALGSQLALYSQQDARHAGDPDAARRASRSSRRRQTFARAPRRSSSRALADAVLRQAHHRRRARLRRLGLSRAARRPTTDTSLDAHSAAIRGLLVGVPRDRRRRSSATAPRSVVSQRLERRSTIPARAIYRATAGDRRRR